MGSERRRRTKILTVRLTDAQSDYLDELTRTASPQRATRADVARHILFGDTLKYRPQCSPKHEHCTAAHCEQVREYQFERDRQLREHEALTSGYAGDIALARENDVPDVITFKRWLMMQPPQPQEDD